MIKISSTAKLPLNICKGSVQERYKLAAKLNADFFNKLSKEFTTKEISKEVFEKTLQSTTPTKINVKVLDYNSRYGGMTEAVLNSNRSEINGFNIYLPLNKYSKQLGIYGIETALHESFHFNSHIVNPKYTARNKKMYETGLTELTEEFYKNTLYAKDKGIDIKTIKEMLNTFLSNFRAEEQINFLQNCRYRLTDEMHAFAEGAKYLDRIQEIHSDKIQEKIPSMFVEEYHFPEKIQMINEKLKEILLKCRAE